MQRSTLLKATVCLPNVGLKSMEVIIKCNHFKLRQAKELVRIYSKIDKEPIRAEFNNSMSNDNIKQKTVFNMLLTDFNELKGLV